jgi:hypothetical protein
MRGLALILGLLIVVIYVQYYRKVSSSVEIIQMSFNDMSMSILSERQPIVFYETFDSMDALVQPNGLIPYTRSDDNTSSEGHVRQTKGLGMVVRNRGNQTASLLIAHPSFKEHFHFNNYMAWNQTFEDVNTPCISVNLRSESAMIVPPHWLYQDSKPDLEIKNIT